MLKELWVALFLSIVPPECPMHTVVEHVSVDIRVIDTKEQYYAVKLKFKTK